MAFEPKAYKVDVVVPLAKDRARMDAVASVIRELKSGAGESALALVHPAAILAIDPRSPGDLTAHFDMLEMSLNKWGGNPPSASLIRQLIEAMKVAGLRYDQPSFWAGQVKAQAGAQAARLGGFVDDLRAEFPLGVLTAEQLEGVARGAGLGGVAIGELTNAVQGAGLAVRPDFDAPATVVPPVLVGLLRHPDFRTVADLVLFPGQARDVSFIDRFTSDGRAITLADVAAAHRATETAKDSNAVQDARKALGLLRSQCATDAQLHQLVLAALLKQIQAILSQGGTRLRHRDDLVARGLAAEDAARVVSKLTLASGGSVARPPSVQIAEALASGDLAEARRFASSLPEADEDRVARTAALARLDAAERLKQTHLDAYEQAFTVRDFGRAAQAIGAAARIDTADEVLRSRLEALPPARPQAPSLRSEGHTVVVTWRPLAEAGVEYVVVRREGAAPVAPEDGSRIGAIVTTTSVTDERPPIGRRVYYAVFSTRDRIRFSDAASTGILVVPTPTELVATSDASSVSLSWRMPVEAIAAQVTQQAADGGITTFDVTRGCSLSLPGLALGMTYDYGVRAVYATGTARELSPPAHVRAVPRGTIRAVQDFEVRHREAGSGGSYDISWRVVEGYVAEVWAFPIGFRSAPGSRVSMKALTAGGGRRLTALPGGGESGGVVTRRFPASGGVSAFAALTIDGDVGVLGKSVVSGRAPSVADVVAERFGDAVKLSWVWPDGDYVMEVSWRQNDNPRSSRVTRAKYRVDGGVTIGPATEIAGIAVATVVRAAEEEWVSTPVPIPFSGVKPTVGYTLAVRKRFLREGSVEVRIDPQGYSGPLEVELVCATGPFMPGRASDGRPIARERLTLAAHEPATFECAMPRLPSPHWVRLFTADDVQVALLDPPTAQMKG